MLVLGGLAFAIPLLPGPLPAFVGWGLTATVLVTLAILAFFFEFEASAISSKEIGLVAILGTLAAMLRVPFATIPSVQPSTYLIICSGYVFGPVAGFMVGAITPLVSNFFLGQGPWTPYQMFAWGLVGFTAAFIRRLNLGRIGLMAFGVAWGYLYGWILNTWFWLSFIYPLTLKTFLIYQLNSFWFDTFHAVGNVIFIGLFASRTIAIFERFRKRFTWGGLGTEPTVR